MPKLSRFFLSGSIYHVFNRGVEKRVIFENAADFRHFLLTLSFYQQIEPRGQLSKSKYKLTDRSPDLLFDVVAYCLMPNHFHLILKQLTDGGITRGLSNLLNSYTRYFNTKHRRIGHLFQGGFKSVNVLTDEQFMQLVRYLFLNPYVANINDEPERYRWSSMNNYLNNSRLICNHNEIDDHFSSKQTLRDFVNDFADYARNLELIKHDVLD